MQVRMWDGLPWRQGRGEGEELGDKVSMAWRMPSSWQGELSESWRMTRMKRREAASQPVGDERFALWKSSLGGSLSLSEDPVIIMPCLLSLVLPD